jgi:hypothetical protein
MSEVIENQNIVRTAGGSALPSVHTNDTSPVGVMMSALKQGASLEQVEKMMDLQDRWQRGEARKAYDAAFAAFKGEAVSIFKGRKVTDGPLKGKSYAELHDWVDAVTPALSKHGLSSSWKLTKDEPAWMEVTCYLRHVGGHEESVSMGGPPDAGGAKNAIQARASTMSYLERYTLKAITGLSEAGDDTDGRPPAQKEKITQEQVANLEALGEEVKANMSQFLKYLKVEKLEDLPAVKYDSAIKALEGKRKQ